jgi:hypothetical protein
MNPRTNAPSHQLTTHDVELIESLCDERAKLRRQMLQLTNEVIAQKFDVPVAEISRIAKYRNARRPGK